MGRDPGQLLAAVDCSTSTWAAKDAPQTSLEVKEAMFVQIGAEVQERRHFLEEMRALGEGSMYEGQILREIGQRVQQMRILDRDIEKMRVNI